MKQSENGFSLVEALIIIVLLAILGLTGWLVHHKGKAQAQKNFVSYSDCVSHGGQSMSYDGAIQFEACKGTDSNLHLQYSAQDLPRIDQNKTTTTPNVVVSTAVGSADLVNYLTYNYTGCGIGQPANSKVTGYFKIVKEVSSGWALMNYGCSNDSSSAKNSTYMIAMDLSSGWVEISPTNNFLPNGTPSCLLVDMFRVPGSLTGQCYQNTGYNDNSLRKVTD